MKRLFPGLLLLFAALILLNAVLLTASAQEGENRKELTELLNPNWIGDLDGMLKRDKVRALVVFNKIQYFLDGARQLGASYELLKEFEKELNKERKGTIKVRIIYIPVSRDDLIPALLEGRGDLAVANLTITPERQSQVDFSDPLLEDVSELLVTGPSSPKVESIDDLAGREIYARQSSSYYQHLLELNGKFKVQGRPAMVIRKADENLEDSDLLEMVNADMIPIVVVDSHKGKFWRDIFEDITVHENIIIHTGGRIGWAFRKNSPKLKEAVDKFVKGHKKGTLMGNILYKRYLKTNEWAKKSLSEKEQEKLREVIMIFRTYSYQYDLDWLMVAALAYQESHLDHSKRSHAGAIGIMQLLRSTAEDPNVNIPDIDKLENNVHAGVKYLRFLRDRYFSNPEIDSLNQLLFSIAAYNAGPARVRKLCQEAAEQSFNPDVWFGNVEVIAARRIGRETVQYVSNVYKYFLAYQLIWERYRSRMAAKHTAAGTVPAAKNAVESKEKKPRPGWPWFVGCLVLVSLLLLWRRLAARDGHQV